MQLPIVLNENPFEILALPVDADARALRARLDELEMEAQFGRIDRATHESNLRSAKLLENPETRIECEMLATWRGAGPYMSLWEDHDYAVAGTRRSLDHRSAQSGEDIARTVRAWLGVLTHPDIDDVVSRRIGAVGANLRPGDIVNRVTSAVIPPLIARGLTPTLANEPALANALRRLKGGTGVSSAEILVQHVDALTANVAGMEQLSDSEFDGFSTRLFSLADTLLPVHPDGGRRILAAGTHATIQRAWQKLNGHEDSARATALLEGLLTRDISIADKAEVEGDLKSIRFRTAWAQALKSAEAQDWSSCERGLLAALPHAESDEERARVESSLATVRQNAAASNRGIGLPGAEGLSIAQALAEIERGGRFVVYEYVISLLIVSFKQVSGVEFVRAGEGGVGRGVPYILLTLVLGWWSLWGFFWTLGALYTNLNGGRDVTAEVLDSMGLPRRGLYQRTSSTT